MGGRGAKGLGKKIRNKKESIFNSDGSLTDKAVSILESNGFKRWQKNDLDRLYLNKDGENAYIDVKTGIVHSDNNNLKTELQDLTKKTVGDKIKTAWERNPNKIEDLNINFNKNVDNSTATVKNVEIYGNRDGTVDLSISQTIKRDTPLYDRGSKKYSYDYSRNRADSNMKVEIVKEILNNSLKTKIFSKCKNYSDIKKVSDKINKKFPGTFDVWKSEW